MTTSYTQGARRAAAGLLPRHPVSRRCEAARRARRGGVKPVFPDFAAAIKPTEFAPGVTFGTGTMAPVDYMVALADGKVPPPANLNIRTDPAAGAVEGVPVPLRAVRDAARRRLEGARLHRDAGRLPDAQRALEVLGRRPARGVQELGGDRRHPQPARRAAGHPRTLPAARAAAPRRDEGACRRTSSTWSCGCTRRCRPGKIGLAGAAGPEGDTRGESAFGPNGGLTEVLIPAGLRARRSTTPSFALSADKKRYVATNNNTPTTLPAPGLPFSLVFRADPGREDLILKVASAYQAASKRRVPPPAFGPLPTSQTSR